MPIAKAFPDCASGVTDLALSWVPPSTSSVAAGQTSAVIDWGEATGGTAPYFYSNPGVSFDSQAGSTTALYATTGSSADPGVTTASGLVNGQTIVLARQVTDATGASRIVQAVVRVAAGAATLSFASAPSNQTGLASTTTSATIGTWGSASGGTGPYSYAVTEVSGNGTTIAGSNQGPWTVSGLTAGLTYVFLMTVTDALLAKGYSVVTISVEASDQLGRWIEVDSVDFTDANWTDPGTITSTTQSTTAWYATLNDALGNPRCYLYNNVADSRTITLSQTDGVKIVNGATTTQPTIGFWPAGWSAMLGGSRRDVWLIEAVIAGEEPSGNGAFTHMCGISTNGTTLATSPGTGLRFTESSSNVIIGRAFTYISGFGTSTLQTLTGGPRTWAASLQVTIADSRRHDIFTNFGATDFCTPYSGLRVRTNATATNLTAVNAESASDGFPWFDTSIQSRTKFWVYHDGSSTTGASIKVKKLRLLRMIQGSN